jgi:hypothetical protein
MRPPFSAPAADLPNGEEIMISNIKGFPVVALFVRLLRITSAAVMEVICPTMSDWRHLKGTKGLLEKTAILDGFRYVGVIDVFLAQYSVTVTVFRGRERLGSTRRDGLYAVPDLFNMKMFDEVFFELCHDCEQQALFSLDGRVRRVARISSAPDLI